jgi:hypothetical protein
LRKKKKKQEEAVEEEEEEEKEELEEPVVDLLNLETEMNDVDLLGDAPTIR